MSLCERFVHASSENVTNMFKKWKQILFCRQPLPQLAMPFFGPEQAKLKLAHSGDDQSLLKTPACAFCSGGYSASGA
jgi:hypothetical protein